MKRLFFIGMLLIIAFCGLNAQSAFEKFANHEEVTSIYISKQMLSLISDSNIQDPAFDSLNLQGVSKKLSGIHILMCESPETVALLQKEKAYFNRSNGYELLMQVNDEDQRMSLFMKKGAEENEYVLSVDEDDTLTMIKMEGKLTLKEIMQVTEIAH